MHVRPLVNTKSAQEVALLPEITSFAVELLRGHGGALSSEHGDGRARSSFNRSFFGEDLYDLYCDVKRLFDPDNLLNPGNIVHAGDMTEHLRYGPGYSARVPETQLDFSNDLGMDRAVEMCNGAGVCRKLSAGTMCPSFMATREEEHSTRGRANALRAVMSGIIPGGLANERLKGTMDLCLECKACATECPSSVDMTRLKVEYLAQRHELTGVPLRSRLFGHVADQNRMFSGAAAELFNQAGRFSAARWLLEKTVGISRHRSLPPVAPRPFTHWFESPLAFRRRSAERDGRAFQRHVQHIQLSGDGAGRDAVSGSRRVFGAPARTPLLWPSSGFKRSGG